MAIITLGKIKSGVNELEELFEILLLRDQGILVLFESKQFVFVVVYGV